MYSDPRFTIISSSLLHSTPRMRTVFQHVFAAYPLLLIHGYLFLGIHSIKVRYRTRIPSCFSSLHDAIYTYARHFVVDV